MNSLDRAVGCIVGVAVGDAMGAGLEFTSSRRSDGSDWETEMRGGGTFGWQPGETTDDTAMTVAVLDMYLDNGGKYNQEMLVQAWLDWYAKGPKDIGSWTAQALQAWIRKGNHGHPLQCDVDSWRQWRRHLNPPHPIVDLWEKAGRNSAGNGGVMRCAPTALVQRPSQEHLSRDVQYICEDTHPDPRCIASCQVVVEACAQLIRRNELPVEATYANALQTAFSLGCMELYNALTARKTAPWSQWNCSGYTIDTTASAFAALLAANSFEAGILMVINRGQDADTVGAVAGAMLGAKYGLKGIPERWLNTLRGRDALIDKATRLWQMSHSA